MTVTPEDVDQFVRNHWHCNHGDHAERIENGRCGACGCALYSYKITVSAGDKLITGAGGFAFNHNGDYIWYERALYILGILATPETMQEQFRTVAEALAALGASRRAEKETYKQGIASRLWRVLFGYKWKE